MRIVGKRKLRKLGTRPSGPLLEESARINEGYDRVTGLASTFIPKGVYRFASAEAADAHRERCLALGMAQLAGKRR